MAASSLLALMTCVLISLVATSASLTFTSKLIHRFSGEAREVAAARGGRRWPARRSAEYYEVLARSDFQRQKRRLGGRYQMLFPSEGSEAFSLGNDFGWLYYTWVDIGTPNVSFLVALDTGSDLFWVPCDCIQCAPLSGYHSSLDKDLSMYSPVESTTSRHLPCGHDLCTLGSSCKNPKQPCPYNITYYSENTSSVGLLVEDTLRLASGDGRSSLQASVIIGCGRRQSGGYLDGVAPDGLLGLGLGDIAVPSFLARAGLVQNSFSMCFKEDDSGRIYFGDQGVRTQQSTPFIQLDGKYITYVVEVERICIGHKSLEETSVQALVDSGSSFSFLPKDVYNRVSLEFDKQVNASRVNYDGSPWDYCYKASPLEMPELPTLTLIFAVNKSFLALDPIFHIYGKEGELAGFCLALQSTAESVGIIGQNFMTGYRIVFDRENLKLGWSQSDCQDIDNSRKAAVTPPANERPENPLPTNERHSSPNAHAVSPAVAGRAPTSTNDASSIASPKLAVHLCMLLLLTQFAVFSFD